jgi:hypothetical protein
VARGDSAARSEYGIALGRGARREQGGGGASGVVGHRRRGRAMLRVLDRARQLPRQKTIQKR